MLFWDIIYKTWSPTQVAFAQRWADEMEEFLFNVDSADERVRLGEQIRLGLGDGILEKEE